MIELRVRDYDDEEFCICGSHHTSAILKVDRIKIPLCLECLEELKDSIEDFCKPQYCYQCKYFKPSKYGYIQHGGSCCLNKEISDDSAGLYEERDYMDSCKNFTYNR